MRVKGELFNDFDSVEQAACGVLDRTGQEVVFDRLSWFRRVSEFSAPGRAPLIAHAQFDGSQAWLFLERRRAGYATGLANWYTLAFRPVFAGGPDSGLKRQLLAEIARQLAPELATVALWPVPHDDGSADLIKAAFRDAGWFSFKTQNTVSWTIDVSGKSFADFWSERPGQLRNTHDRKLKKFGIICEIHTQHDPDAWAIYEEIYRESWKGEEGSMPFIRAMSMAKAQAGALRLGIAKHQGRAIAAQLWSIENGRAIIHKLAYRADAAELSAGTILSSAMFRHAIDVDHVNIIDYGTGDDRYKADWMDNRAMLCHISLFNPKTIRGMCGAVRAWISGKIRQNTF